jgi:hypothetical protein
VNVLTKDKGYHVYQAIKNWLFDFKYGNIIECKVLFSTHFYTNLRIIK